MRLIAINSFLPNHRALPAAARDGAWSPARPIAAQDPGTPGSPGPRAEPCPSVRSAPLADARAHTAPAKPGSSASDGRVWSTASSSYRPRPPAHSPRPPPSPGGGASLPAGSWAAGIGPNSPGPGWGCRRRYRPHSADSPPRDAGARCSWADLRHREKHTFKATRHYFCKSAHFTSWVLPFSNPFSRSPGLA